MTEYSANALQTKVIDLSPFFLNAGQDPKMDFDLNALRVPESTNERL
jgi:hypothetical protein